MRSQSGYDSLASTSLSDSPYLNSSGRFSTIPPPPATPYKSSAISFNQANLPLTNSSFSEPLSSTRPNTPFDPHFDKKYHQRKLKLQQDIARKQNENQLLAQRIIVSDSTPQPSFDYLRPPTIVHRSNSSPNLQGRPLVPYEHPVVLQHHVDPRLVHKRIFQTAWENVMHREANRPTGPPEPYRHQVGYIPASEIESSANVHDYDKLDSPILKPKKLRPTKVSKKIQKNIRSLSATRERLDREQIRVANAIEGHYYDSYLLDSEDEANEQYMRVSGQKYQDEEQQMISSDEVIRRFLEKQT